MDFKSEKFYLQSVKNMDIVSKKQFFYHLEEKIEKFNFQTLVKIDPKVEKILFTSRYAALHELDRASKIWHACEKAGPLFIVKRKNEQPKFIFFILNQKSNIDFAEEIFENMKIEMKENESFLFFETKEQKVKGLWFSEKEDLKNIFKMVKDLFKD
jgi:hypothetical protein